VRTEALLAVVVLAITSLLVAADPSRTLGSSGFGASKVVDGTIIEVVGSPARTGPVDFHLYATDPSIGLTDRPDITAELSLPSEGIRAISLPIVTEGRAHWSAYDIEVPIKGTWQLVVTIGLSQFSVRTATFPIRIN
jgi:hypothetical protein